MLDSSVLHFLENSAILVTGATGFLAKVFIEKILRVQPNGKKLYLLLRAADQASAVQRFENEVIAKDLFRVLKKKYDGDISTLISDKVRVVCGDVTYENLGVKDSDLLLEMWEQIDAVVDLAANTNLDERYDVSLGINTLGAINVLDFCKRCNKLKILLHVSTAYISGQREGLILETPHKMGEALNGSPGLDIFEEKKLVEQALKKLSDENCSPGYIRSAMKKLGMQRAKKFGWPNTYVFTKAMGEMLLGEVKESMPIVTIRPAMVTSTYKEPFSGWIEGIKTVDIMVVEHAKGKLPCFLIDPNTVLDLIPVDMVANAVIVAVAAHSVDPGQRPIYHVGSSASNPFLATRVFDYSFRYFSGNPLISGDGKPIIVDKVTILDTRESFRRHMEIHYALPLEVLRKVNTMCFQPFQSLYTENHRNMESLVRLNDTYEPYSVMKGIFDDTNTEKLRRAVKENGIEADIFYFDPKAINWEDYFINTHIRGVVNHNSLVRSRL